MWSRLHGYSREDKLIINLFEATCFQLEQLNKIAFFNDQYYTSYLGIYNSQLCFAFTRERVCNSMKPRRMTMSKPIKTFNSPDGPSFWLLEEEKPRDDIHGTQVSYVNSNGPRPAGSSTSRGSPCSSRRNMQLPSAPSTSALLPSLQRRYPNWSVMAVLSGLNNA